MVAAERLHDDSLLARLRDVIASSERDAETSGAAAGKSAEAVREDIGADRKSIIHGFDAASGSPDALKKQEADLGKVAIDCALLHALSDKAPH